MTRYHPQFKLRIPPDLKRWLEMAAMENHRSVSGQIIYLLAGCMKNEETEEAQLGGTTSTVSQQ